MTYQEWKKKFVDGEDEEGLENAEKSDIITGARITDPESPEAEKFATMYYEEIRHFSTDVEKIADHLQVDVESIRKIKNYLFIDDSFYDEDKGIWRRFYEDCEIAQSWQRLMIGKQIQPHDRLLIQHELYEMQLKHDNPQMSHDMAHTMATLAFNYQGEAKKYYDNLKRNK